MTNSYIWVALARRLRQCGLAALLMGGTAVAAQAQALNYSAFTTLNVAGTYTDLGTAGTAIATANTDDANSAPQEIGFTFPYNGATFTQFVFNTNGVIRLGGAAPSTAALYYDNNDAGTSTDPLVSTNPADVNLLMPFNQDLVPGSGAGGSVDYRVLTSGTAPNRICTIQWRNVADKAGAGSDAANMTQYANFSFQIKLYETGGIIEFVYDQALAGGGTAGARFPNVGLKGSGLGNGQLVLALKGTTAAWSSTTFQNTNYGNVAHNITRSVRPDAGRTYRFAQPVPNDVAVRAVYTLGKIATPGALPQPVRAFLANFGTTAQNNVAVTLTVSGANTFTRTVTIATLGVGVQGTLAFPDLPATLNLGTNTVTVSVLSDDNNTNNSASVTQLVTPNRLSYIEPDKDTDSALSGSNTSAGSVLSVKYTVPGAVVLSDALISFANFGTNLTTSFQVLVYDATGTDGTPGNVLYTSPAQDRPAAGGDVTVTLPNLQLSGAFHVGVKEVGTTGIGIATQSQTPLRATTYYFSPNGSAPWTDIAATSLQRRLAIEVGLAAAPGCDAPTGLAVASSTPTTAVVSFTGAGNAGNYQLIYGPVGFQPGTGGTTVAATASPVTLTGLQPGTTYQVYARTNCSAGGTSLLAGPVNFTTACDAVTTVSTFPYAEGFDNIPVGQARPCGLTVLDANNDGTTWAVSRVNPNSGTSSIRYNALTLNNVAADDWFFTPALTLTGTTRYQLAFRYRAEGLANTTSSFTESLEVKTGSAPTVAAQTTLLYTNAAITNTAYALANGTSTPVVALLPAGASTQYVGFHVKSAANQGSLYIDDVTVTAAAVTATSSEALLRAVSVFPNPSTTGLFDLEIHGAKAKGRLEVLVTNGLGQRVYVGSARDNYTNKLDLSALAPGIYQLQVRNGDEQLTRRVSIVK